jgi:hypothetical protein
MNHYHGMTSRSLKTKVSLHLTSHGKLPHLGSEIAEIQTRNVEDGIIAKSLQMSLDYRCILNYYCKLEIDCVKIISTLESPLHHLNHHCFEIIFSMKKTIMELPGPKNYRRLLEI